MENPLTDNRLKKMAAQKTTKSVLDYIRQNCAKAAQPTEGKGGGGGKGKGKQQPVQQEEEEEEEAELADRMTVMSINEANPDVIATSAGNQFFGGVFCTVRNSVVDSDPSWIRIQEPCRSIRHKMCKVIKN